MKQVIAVLFLFIFSLQVFYTAVVNVWFYANRGAIAEKFCVNKNQSQLKCNGQCFLSKKLKESEENKQNQTPSQLKKPVESTPCIISSIHYLAPITTVSTEHHPQITNAYTFTAYKDIFHPPSVI